MRRVIESTLVSADGVIGEPHSWTGDHFTEKVVAQALEQLNRSGKDIVLYGHGPSARRCWRTISSTS